MSADSQGEETRAVRRLQLLVWLMVGAVGVSLAAGLILLAAEPESGSSAEATLGLLAAVGGLAAAGFAIAAFIYAQVKNLWRLAPTWIRVVLWIVIAVGVAVTLWNLVSSPFGS